MDDYLSRLDLKHEMTDIGHRCHRGLETNQPGGKEMEASHNNPSTLPPIRKYTQHRARGSAGNRRSVAELKDSVIGPVIAVFEPRPQRRKRPILERDGNFPQGLRDGRRRCF